MKAPVSGSLERCIFEKGKAPQPGRALFLRLREALDRRSVVPLKKVNREAAARRPARSERKDRAFSAKRQAAEFETHSVAN